MSRFVWIACLSMWISATGLGIWKAIVYESTPAEVTTPPERWPANCRIERDPSRPTLVVFVHPKCPCTQATVRELDRLLTQHRGRVAVRAIVWKPAEISEDWAQTELVAQVSALPDVAVVIDHGGAVRQQFRTSVSGECLLYDTDGRLTFHGGVTQRRGHEGPSVGQAAIAAALADTPTVPSAPVFGCPLETPQLETPAESSQVSPQTSVL